MEDTSHLIIMTMFMKFMMIMTMVTLTVRPWSRPPESVKPQGTAEECRVSVSSEMTKKSSFRILHNLIYLVLYLSGLNDGLDFKDTLFGTQLLD